MGYRLGDALSLIQTGGIYAYSNVGNMTFSLDGKPVKTSGIFQRNAFIDNLHGGMYRLSLEKNGYRAWAKDIKVIPNRVAEVHAFSLPTSFKISQIPKYEKDKIINPDYTSAIKLMSATSTKIATSSLPVSAASSSQFLAKKGLRVMRSMMVWIDNGNINLIWKGDSDATPYFLCTADVCNSATTFSLALPVQAFDFYPGRDDVLVVQNKDGIFAVELDTRFGTGVYEIMRGEGLTFKVASDSLIYIKNKAGDLFSVPIE
jgi:hypothetical protein